MEQARTAKKLGLYFINIDSFKEAKWIANKIKKKSKKIYNNNYSDYRGLAPYLMGKIHIKQGKFKKALHYFTKAKEMNQSYGEFGEQLEKDIDLELENIKGSTTIIN